MTHQAWARLLAAVHVVLNLKRSPVGKFDSGPSPKFIIETR